MEGPITVRFTDDDHKVKTKVQRTSDRYFFPRDYVPPTWDPLNDEDFDPDETIMFYGMRREGKSTLSRYLALLLRRLYPFVFVVTGTSFNNFWQQVLPESKVLEVDFTDKSSREATLNAPCKQLLDVNARRVSKWKQAQSEHRATGNPLTLVIGDDIVTNDTVRQCPAATQIMLNGRHHGIPAWILTQVWVGLTPAQRKNLDRVFLYKATDFAVEEWVVQTYGAHVLDMYRRVTDEPFTAFVIVNKARVKGTRFYKFKADIEWVRRSLDRDVVLGNSRMWADTDVKEQKRRLPDVSMASSRTLRRKFEEPVGTREEEPDDADDELLAVTTASTEEPVDPATKPFRSW